MEINDNGPFLGSALLCEKVLQEKDETVSIIRITDRITLTAPAATSPEHLPAFPLNLSAFISFKSGSAKGRMTARLIVEAPSGLKSPEQLYPVLFEGDDRGVNLIISLNMMIEQEGVYWFILFSDDQFMTRVPLRILYQRIGQSGQ